LDFEKQWRGRGQSMQLQKKSPCDFNFEGVFNKSRFEAFPEESKTLKEVWGVFQSGCETFLNPNVIPLG